MATPGARATCEHAAHQRSRHDAADPPQANSLVTSPVIHRPTSASFLTLSMVLGHGDNYTSTWKAAADYVHKRLERDA